MPIEELCKELSNLQYYRIAVPSRHQEYNWTVIKDKKAIRNVD